MNAIKSFVLYVMTIIVSILFGVLGYEWMIRRNGAKRSEAEKAVRAHEMRWHTPYTYTSHRNHYCKRGFTYYPEDFVEEEEE